MNTTNPTHAVDGMATAVSSWASSAARLCRLALSAALLALSLATFAADQRTFSAPEAAVDALIAALKSNDQPALVALVGDKYKNLVVTGDAANDAAKHAEAA